MKTVHLQELIMVEKNPQVRAPHLRAIPIARIFWVKKCAHF